jgi:hypothetical protein
MLVRWLWMAARCIYTMLGIYLPSATCLMGGSVLSVLVLLSRAGFPRLFGGLGCDS